MRITDLDPLQHGLIFERFLNPERVSMPDFDVDFDERRRGEVIRYVTEKYGDERVAQIVTYGTIKAKQALKDAARVLGFPFAMGEKLTKAMPPAIMGKDIPLAGIFDNDHKRYNEAGEFREVHDADPQAQEVVETALGLEGLKRQWGVHAAGVIMSSEPLIDLIPIMRREQDGQIITQFDYPSCETLGLVKMDFLGLRNLTILDDALANVEANRGDDVDLEALRKDLDRPRRLRAAGRGDTLGVFQLDGGGMRTLLRQMQPDRLRGHLGRARALPAGPDGRQLAHQLRAAQERPQPVTPIHPELAEPLEDILGTTYGLIVYQEQVMPIAQKVAGYTLGQADLLREAMGKKKKEVLDAEFARLRGGHAGQRLQRRRDQDAVGHPGAVLRLRVQQGARRGLRRGLLLDRLPQGELPRRVHGRAADQRARRQGQVRALPQRVPPDGHQGAAARRQRVGRPTSPPSAPTSGSGWPRSATSAPTSSTPIVARARGEGPVRLLQGLPAQGAGRGLQQAHDRVADQGRSVRLPRHTRRGSSRCTSSSSTPSSTSSARRPSARTRLFGGVRRRRRRRRLGRLRGAAAVPTTSGTSRRCSPSSGRCSGCTSPTTRCSASSTSSPSTPTPRSPPSWATSRKPDGTTS